MKTPALFTATALLLSACAGDISPAAPAVPASNGNTPAVVLPGPGGAQSSFTKNASGTYTGVVNSTGSDWIYIDLEMQKQVTPADPAVSDAWDIAFKASEIKVNGGVSGKPPTGKEVRIYGDKSAAGSSYDFDKVTAAPPEGAVEYRSDAVASSSLDNSPVNPVPQQISYAFNTYPDPDQARNSVTGEGDSGWLHNSGLAGGSQITARRNVAYTLKSVECRFYKLRLTSYANAAGAAGHPSFEFVEIPGNACTVSGLVAPLGRAVFSSNGEGGQKVAINATDNDAWVHLDLTNAKQVAPANPNSDPQGWDLAFKRTDIKLNSGPNGTGTVKIWDGLRDNWAMRAAAPPPATNTYHVDEEGKLAFITYPPREHMSEPACGNINGDFGWYYYSAFCDDGKGLHHIYPRDVVYVVAGRDGNYWKLRVLDYYNAAGSSGYPSIEFQMVTKP